MHRGPKPAGQPNGLRTIAEEGNAPANFSEDPQLVNGVPVASGVAGTYVEQDAGHPVQSPSPQKLSPFTNVKKGR
jgi:hypothetical protein